MSQSVDLSKPGDLKYIDSVEHIKDENGKWVPHTKGDSIKNSIMNAGMSLLGQVKKPKSSEEEAAETPYDDPYKK